LDGLLNDLHPKGTLEELLVEELAVLSWRYRRLIVAEAENSQAVDNFGRGRRIKCELKANENFGLLAQGEFEGK
jgi:hypothetical protein